MGEMSVRKCALAEGEGVNRGNSSDVGFVDPKPVRYQGCRQGPNPADGDTDSGVNMLLDRLNRSREEEGFSLIELLVVIAIIGILAAIAIAVFSSQRNSARDASVKSDINGAAKVVETFYVNTQGYPTDANAATDLTGDYALQVSPGNTIYYLADGTSGFILFGCNDEAQQMYSYLSGSGGLDPSEPTASAACAVFDNAVTGGATPVLIGSGA